MPGLEVTLLGSLEVQVNGRPVTRFRSANVQGLLIYLLLNRQRPITRETLATLFWPDEPDRVAKQNLRQTLYQLRKSLEDGDGPDQPLLHVNRRTIQFNAEAHYSLDVEQFHTAIAEGELERAALLYVDELAPGFTCDSAVFEDWLRQERQQLRRLALQTLVDWAERQMRNGRPQEAQSAARRHLSLEPWSETAHQQLIEALALAGDRSGALAQFERCREVLAEELGVSPSPETVALVRRIEQNELRPADPDLIAGRYALEKEIGRGAMGIVFRGRDSRTGEAVAIKMLDAEKVAGRPDLLQRFLREGEALQKLDHPNIVKLLATDERDGRHYLVMEHIAGGDLGALLQRDESLSLQAVLTIALDLADALTRAHHLGILHRDVKPANILLDEAGLPRLTDFGIARLGPDSDVTEAGEVLGTIAYLSPEACMGKELDSRADIWSFGVVLYEMLTGLRPFADATAAGTVTRILHEPVADVAPVRPDLPAALEDLLLRMLTKNRDERIPSARLVGAELEALLQGTPLPGGSQAGPAAPARRPFAPSAFATPTPERLGRKRHNLPAQTTPFVGRETELAELHRLLADSAARLVSITGPGGMGKSRLMLEAARGIIADEAMKPAAFVDGIFFVELAAVETMSAFPAAMAATLGFTLEHGLAPFQQLFDYFSNKRLLLLLDNFEHLLPAPHEGAAAVAALLEAAPDLKVVVSSRQKLNLSSEVNLVLEGLDLPAGQTPDDAVGGSAVQLFLQSARRAHLDFELTVENLPHIDRICHLTEGMPLGIVLAAAWVEMLSPAEIAAQIQADIDFLTANMGDLPPRQRSMRAVFDYSWHLLNEEEQRLLARLSVFRGGFSRAAAQAVTGAPLRRLLALVNKSLLQRHVASGRFTLHELIQQLAAEKLERFGETAAARRAHGEHYLSWLAKHQAGLEQQVQLETLRKLRPDDQNLQAAGLWAAETGATDQLLAVMHAFPYYFFLAGREHDAIAFYRQLLQHLPEGDGSLSDMADDTTFLRACLLNRLQDLGYVPGDGEAAIDIDRLLTYFQARGARLEEALVYQHLGYRAQEEEGAQRALHFFGQQETIYRQEGEVFRLPNCLGRTAMAALFAGEVEASRQLSERFLATVREYRNVLHEPVALSFTAVSALFDDLDYEGANELFVDMAARGRAIWQEGLSIWALVGGLLYQGIIALLQGQLEAARRIERELRDVAEVRNSPREIRRVSSFTSLLNATEGRYQEAEVPALPSSGSRVLSINFITVALTAYGQGDRQLALATCIGAWSIPITRRWPALFLQYMPVVCALLADQEAHARAAALMAMSRAHPACPRGWWEIMDLVREVDTRLQEALTKEELRAAQRQGRELVVEETAPLLLEELKTLAATGS
ncbi:MAG: protein kinase [Candidatus Promineifilaceae bacterium]|nr:protein kinase [Candidatus Promineifilaceae bacterium]